MNLQHENRFTNDLRNWQIKRDLTTFRKTWKLTHRFLISAVFRFFIQKLLSNTGPQFRIYYVIGMYLNIVGSLQARALPQISNNGEGDKSDKSDKRGGRHPQKVMPARKRICCKFLNYSNGNIIIPTGIIYSWA